MRRLLDLGVTHLTIAYHPVVCDSQSRRSLNKKIIWKIRIFFALLLSI